MLREKSILALVILMITTAHCAFSSQAMDKKANSKPIQKFRNGTHAIINIPEGESKAFAARTAGGNSQLLRAQAEHAAQVADTAAEAPLSEDAQKHAFVETFLANYNVRETSTRAAFGGHQHTGENGSIPLYEVLKKDPRWIRSAETLIKSYVSHDSLRGGSRDSVRVLSGDLDYAYNDCVAVCLRRGRDIKVHCTGTLIRPRVVLIAGHCLDISRDPQQFVVVAAANAYSPRADQVFRVSAVQRPSDYVREQGCIAPPIHDIGLLLLARPVPSAIAKPRTVASSDDISKSGNRPMRIAGYGTTDNTSDEDVDGNRRKVDVAVTTCDCAEDGDESRYLCARNREIVAGGVGKDTCKGDSGGPIYVLKPDTPEEQAWDERNWLLAGVTSRGIPSSGTDLCGTCGDGGIYTRVDWYGEWIYAQIAAWQHRYGMLL